MDYQDQYRLPRSSPPTPRSLSVASATSYASNHSSFRPESRALSTTSIISVPAPSMLTTTHYQHSHLHAGLPSSSSYTLPSTLHSSPYLQSHISSPMPVHTSIPPPEVFGQQFSSSFNFQLNTLPYRPSPYPTYPPLYPSLSNASAYHQPSSIFKTRSTVKFFKWADLPPEIMNVIRAYVGYLESRKLVALNRWFRDNFHIRHFSEDQLVAGVLEAEQGFKRYHMDSQKTLVNREGESETAPADSFACYHCYKMKSPKNFERFFWPRGAGNDDGRNNNGDDVESHYSASATATASTPNTQRSGNPSLTTLPNPYYDPTITRSGILQAQAASRKSSSNNSSRRRSHTPATATVAVPAPGANNPTATGPVSTSGLVKSTWGVRRFCIPCGVKKGFYRKTDLIEVHGARNVVNWVCGCLEVRDRSISPSCDKCGLHSPYEPPGNRRQRP